MHQESPESRETAMVHEKPSGDVASTSPGTPLPPQSPPLTCPPFRFSTATESCVCISSTMGADPHFLRSSPLQFTSRHYCLDWPDLFPLTLFTQPV